MAAKSQSVVKTVGKNAIKNVMKAKVKAVDKKPSVKEVVRDSKKSGKLVVKPAEKQRDLAVRGSKSKLSVKNVRVQAPAPSIKNMATAVVAKAKAALKAQVQPEAAKPLLAESASSPAPVKKTRKISLDIGPNEAASAIFTKWNSLYKKAQQMDVKPYNMKAVFEEKTAIMHKVLGWGYILANRNDRLEVLFKDGIKYLISNYKP